MIVLIDGYNLLRLIFHHARTQMHAEKKVLLQRLGAYFVYKKATVAGIVVVFDGGEVRHATREVKQGVVVIHSGQRASADDWIIEYIKKHPTQETLLITMDRKLKEAVARSTVHTMDCEDFWGILMTTLVSTERSSQTKSHSGALKKFEHEDDETLPCSSQAVDLLMEEASMRIAPKEADKKTAQQHNKSAQGSKKERGLERILKKL